MSSKNNAGISYLCITLDIIHQTYVIRFYSLLHGLGLRFPHLIYPHLSLKSAVVLPNCFGGITPPSQLNPM